MTAISLLQPVGDQMVAPLMTMAIAVTGSLAVITLVVKSLFNVFRSWR
jgi:hypothetical protein